MKISLVAHDIRSTHNVGAFFRTCDGLGIEHIYFSGYTPYPAFEGDSRLPHFADKLTRQIHKTALGAESIVDFSYYESLQTLMDELKKKEVILIALEQFPGSLTPAACKKKLEYDRTEQEVALLIGNEIHGVKDDILKQMDYIIEIPMKGTKESLNVSVATAIALYELTK